MDNFPKGIEFCYKWRSYQARILRELPDHLANRHLHLVAPPGSGKTVLGLEVMLRLDKPALIVAPTLAIKQQWKERFTELFLGGKQPDWLSMDITQPDFITVTTYQALHSVYQEKKTSEEADEEAADDAEWEVDQEPMETDRARIQRNLEGFGFGTLILDEAHHLRTAWWKSMMTLRHSLQDVHVVALTATPPLDVSALEWERYEELCGPIDLEISVPELVKEKELCPHQDYVHFSAPVGEELMMILRFREEVDRFVEALFTEGQLQNLLEHHPWITDPPAYVQEILDHPAYFSSILVFLKQAGSDCYKEAMPVIGLPENTLPPFTYEWLEELLTGLLFADERIEDVSNFRKRLKQRLWQIGAIERRRVKLRATESMNRKLTHSISKLTGICEIVKSEKDLLQEKLRMVILADYIHLQDLPAASGDEMPLRRIGVVPIFEKIRRELGDDVKIGILTGSLVVLPKSGLRIAEDRAKHHGVEIVWKEMAHDPSYMRADLTAGNRQRIVAVMTDIFSSGGVHVLIGTAALLGEGWDAPCINSLIIASYVGSFMQSNQMRGRAIRVDRENPGKTSSIWHLVCVDRDADDPGHDYALLSRRFRSLVGVSEKEDVIETGLSRLDLEEAPYTLDAIQSMNERTRERATGRNRLFERWQRSIAKGIGMEMEIRTERQSLPRPYYLPHSLKAMTYLAGFAVAGELFDAVRFFMNFRDIPIGAGLWLGLIVGMAFGLPSITKVVKLYMRHPSVESSMAEIGKAVYVALHHAKVVHTPFSEDMVRVTADRMGAYTCWLMEGTAHEKNVFMSALQEFIDPIENPRYLIVRRTGGLLKRKDVHAVPYELARKKEYAQFFHAECEKRLGDCELIYTRTFEGRQDLLRARVGALSAAFVKKAERISGWR